MRSLGPLTACNVGIRSASCDRRNGARRGWRNIRGGTVAKSSIIRQQLELLKQSVAFTDEDECYLQAAL